MNSEFIIITPTKNEEKFIAKTIDSMVRQEVKPICWIIVNDGSTDRTEAIVRNKISNYRFIKLLNLKNNGNRNFSNKAVAFMAAYQKYNRIPHRYIGNLDADIEVDKFYYKKIIEEFDNNPQIGICGGSIYTNINGKYISQDKTQDSVAGAVQLFRTECFEQIKGYRRMEYGGIDAAAEIKAKYFGWEVRKFRSIHCYENRRTGSMQSSPVIYKYKEGKRFYTLGYDPIFYLFRAIYRLKDQPYVIGSLASLCGYFSCYKSQEKILLDKIIVKHLRRQQRYKMLNLLRL